MNIISTTATDAEGRFSFSRIEDGTYNIYCTDSTGLFSTLVTDKSIVGNDSFFIGENTLRPNGTIEGQVINAPPGETAIAFIYGSPIITEVNDTSGLFFLRNLPTGTPLSINFITLKTIDGKRCEAQYQYTTLPDTTRFITVTLECDSTGL